MFESITFAEALQGALGFKAHTGFFSKSKLKE